MLVSNGQSHLNQTEQTTANNRIALGKNGVNSFNKSQCSNHQKQKRTINHISNTNSLANTQKINYIRKKRKTDHLESINNQKHIKVEGLQSNCGNKQSEDSLSDGGKEAIQTEGTSDKREGYQCSVCSKSYRQASSLSMHKKRHLSVVFKCTEGDCARQFNEISGLYRHKVIHTGAKPFQCSVEECAKAFNQKSNLNRHMRLHRQEKPYACQQCEKQFTTTSNLKQHFQVGGRQMKKKVDRNMSL